MPQSSSATRAVLSLPVATALKSPGADAVIDGGVDACGIMFDGVHDALRVSGTEMRRFGKAKKSFLKRRIGVALARHADVEVARHHATLANTKVTPHAK